MANTVCILLLLFNTVLLTFIYCHAYDNLENNKYSHYLSYELVGNNNNHNILKRDSEDDSKFKKGSITKKPIIGSKIDPSSKLSLSKPVFNKSSQINDDSDTVFSNASGISFYDDEEQSAIPSNANQTFDFHTYYNSTFYSDPNVAMNLWVNITAFPKTQIITHEMLSNSHRRAATVALPFDFPFYGHPMKNMTIATGGFLYAGDHVHSWLAATQYIAALMANFDTSLSNASAIQYAFNDTAFVVQWSDVMLQDKSPEGNFSFQIILLKNGDIIFVYKDIPFPIQDIPDSKHPVKVGISDAYIIDRTVFFIRRKTIYEYHRADLKKSNITNNTAIYFTALPTCLSMTNCDSCVSANIGFECGWCDAVQRCSDGFDRHRQDWIVKNCEVLKDNKCLANITFSTSSPNYTSTIQTVVSTASVEKHYDVSNHSELQSDSSYYNHENIDVLPKAEGSAGLVSVLIILAFLSGIALWVFYAYKNPQSASGQLLIKYRPSQWRWGGSEARYTAASIHM